jgi:hypothetical protein
VLNRHDGLACTGSHLTAMSPRENDQLYSCIRRAAQTSAGRGTGAGGDLRVSRPSNRRPLAVLVTPLHVPPSPPFEDTRAVANVFVSDPEDAMQADARVMRSLWGLTKTETRTQAELARLLSVSLLGRISQA